MFDRAYDQLLIIEGGHSKRKSDRGGETFCGISRVHHPEWPGWAMVDGHLQRGGQPSQLTKIPFLMGQVKNFYRVEYWDKLRCDKFPVRIACELFDSGVNCGKTTAARWLQRAVNLFADQDILAEDGVIGAKTVAKTLVQIANFGDTHLLKSLNGQQYMHYHTLVERDPGQRVNLRGWLTRVWEDHLGQS
jgi:lysozyme family protein